MAGLTWRISISPWILAPTHGKSQPIMCLLNADFAVNGKQVRLMVYDKEKFRVENTGKGEGISDPAKQASPSKGDPLWKFKTEFMQLTGAELNPPVNSGANGVLFKIDLRLTKRDKPFEWLVSRGPLTQVTAAPVCKIPLRLRLDNGGTGDVGFINIPDFGPGERTLLFRVALLEDAAGFKAGTIIASNIIPEHNRTRQDVKVRIPAAEVKRPAVIGGDGGVTDPTLDSATSRILLPDFTGFYEAHFTPQRTGPIQEPAFMVQMNQAGHLLVGWFVWPHPLMISAPAQVTDSPQSPGCFFAIMENEGPQGWDLFWGQSQGFGESKDDPALNFPMPHHGFLKNASQKANDVLEQELDLTLETEKTTIKLWLVRTCDRARWSTSVVKGMVVTPQLIAKMTESLKKQGKSKAEIDKIMKEFTKRVGAMQTALRAEDLQLAPYSFWERLFRQIGPNSKLAAAITQWARTPGDKKSPARAVARAKVSDEIGNLLDPFRGLPHHQLVVEKFIIFAGQIRLSISGVPGPPQPGQPFGPQVETVLTWLKKIVAEELDALREKNPDVSTTTLYQRILPGFRTAGIQAPGEFVYRMDFDFLGGGFQFVIGLGVYGFDVRIEKFRLNRSTTPPTRTKDQTFLAKYQGVMLEAGAGAKLAIKALTGGSAAVGIVDFESFADLQATDFDDASFSVVATEAGKVTGGPFNVVTAYKSFLIQVTLQNEIRLDAIVEKTGVPPSLKKKHTKLPGLDEEVTAASVAMGYGLFVFGKGDPQKPDEKGPIIPQQVQRADLQRNASIFFERDLATIGKDNRRILERALAIERALFEIADGWLFAVGHTSPEAAEDWIKNLSLFRAANVIQALRDAFGADLAISDVKFARLGRSRGEEVKTDRSREGKAYYR